MKNKFLRTLFLRKSVALLTAVCFVFTSVLTQNVWAFSPASTYPNIFNTQEAHLVPFNLGRITDAFYSGSGKIVINIQDLHSHEETQRNIESILSILDKKYGLKNVYVEGAYGDVSTNWLTSLKDEKAKEQILNNLLASGKVRGCISSVKIFHAFVVA